MKHLFLLFLFPLMLFGQAKLDSLWSIWNDKSQPDTNRLKAIHKIVINGYLYSQPDSAFYLAQLGYDFAESINNKKWMASALNSQGISFSIKGNYEKALIYFKKSLKINEKTGDKKEISITTNNIGLLYRDKGNYEKALIYHQRSLKIKEDIVDKYGIAMSCNNIGAVYHEQGNYEEALIYNQRSLKIREKIGNKKGIAMSYNNIGNIYNEQGNLEEALIYHQRSLKIKEEIGDKRGIAYSLNNIGQNLLRQGNLEEALIYHQKSLKIINQLGENKQIAYSFNNIGEVYQAQGSLEEALIYYKKSLNIRKDIGDQYGIAYSFYNIGCIYKDQGNIQKALTYHLDALSIAMDINVLYLIVESSQSLYRIYKETGKYMQALKMHEIYLVTKDTLATQDAKEAATELKYQHHYETKAKVDSIDNLRIRQVKDKEISRQRQQSYFLYGGLALTLFFAAFIFNRLRLTRRQKKVIEDQKLEVEEQKKDIMSNITYAKKIQDAILPSLETMKSVLPDSFTLYLPKDVVSGDFYWVYKDKQDVAYFTVGDCTGHGVSGAFMSIIGQTLLNELVVNKGMTEVNEILMQMREYIIHYLHQKGEAGEARDGMDMALCRMDISKNKLSYAGAHNSLYLMRGGELIEYKGSMRPVGYYLGKGIPFEKEEIEIKKGDVIYLFSDGYADQFGGPKGKKFMYGKFKKLLLSIHEKEMSEQKTILDETLKDWMKGYEQIDDICVMGIRV